VINDEKGGKLGKTKKGLGEILEIRSWKNRPTKDGGNCGGGTITIKRWMLEMYWIRKGDGGGKVEVGTGKGKSVSNWVFVPGKRVNSELKQRGGTNHSTN